MKETSNESWIIIDLSTKKALYGAETKTLQFSSEQIALEVASQFFLNENKYMIIKINKL